MRGIVSPRAGHLQAPLMAFLVGFSQAGALSEEAGHKPPMHVIDVSTTTGSPFVCTSLFPR
jgi:hypothetical protein